MIKYSRQHNVNSCFLKTDALRRGLVVGENSFQTLRPLAPTAQKSASNADMQIQIQYTLHTAVGPKYILNNGIVPLSMINLSAL